ncbi:MAG: histone deacetylase [Candidatus Omnitrophica bacterium]|nr:histone deacetylase [Candidatus Omnitrophota bacterium]MCM8806458.1 histone deacetylase [Candidatus Omnitrophota bacterium]
MIKFVYSEEFLKYEEPSHPESPKRVESIVNYLKKKGKFSFVEPSPCKEEDLLLVHTEEMIKRVKENDFFDPDCPNIPEIFYYACLSCGSAIKASEICLEGTVGFSLGRPPGHHAGKNKIGGFCYFNNIAVAVKKLLLKNLKIAIIDIDGHHGNGTEEIFRGEKNVIYISLHQFPAYPGTGKYSFENCYNFPISPFSSSKKYMEKFNCSIEIIENFSPDVIAVSCGFDGYKEDPLLNLSLDETDYYIIGKKLGSLKKNLFFVLEGGYNISKIGNLCFCLISGVENSLESKKFYL